MKNKGVFLVFKILISLGLLFILFRGTDTGLFLEKIVSMKPIIFIAALLLFLATQVLSTFRWSLFLFYGGLEMPFFRLLSLYFIGMFFNNFLPTVVGGDLVKGYYLYKSSKKGGVSLASIFVDRYVGFASLVFLALLALLFGYQYIKETVIPWLVIIFILFFLGASLVLWNERFHGWALWIIDKIKFFGINEKIEVFYQSLMRYRKYPKILAVGFGISVILQTIGICIFYVLSKGFGMSVPLVFFFLFVPLAMTVSMIPISLAGLGLREGAFVFLFSKVGVSSASALSLSLAWFMVVVLISFAGCIEYIRMGKEVQTGGG